MVSLPSFLGMALLCCAGDLDVEDGKVDGDSGEPAVHDSGGEPDTCGGGEHTGDSSTLDSDAGTGGDSDPGDTGVADTGAVDTGDTGVGSTAPICGDLGFSGVYPAVTPDVCSDGTYPSAGALAAAALCEEGTKAVLGGVAYGVIQDAVNVSISGDTIYICPGVYGVNLQVGYGLLTLEGVTGDPADVVLDGFADHRILEANYATLQLVNLTFRNGVANYAGGAIEALESQLVVHCCAFENNFAAAEGGAIAHGGYTFPSTSIVASSIVGSSFVDNVSGSAGGAIAFGAAWDDGVLSIVGSSFEGNRAGDEGGALVLGSWRHDDIYVQDCEFVGNVSGDQGGAVQLITWGSATFTAVDSIFVANRAAGSGGAIYLGGWSTSYQLWLEGTVLDGNRSDYAPVLNKGGRVGCSEVHLVQSAITSSESGDHSTVRMYDDAWIRSEASDWGVDASDNSGNDLNCPCGEFGDLGVSETFTCEADGTWY